MKKLKHKLKYCIAINATLIVVLMMGSLLIYKHLDYCESHYSSSECSIFDK
ncbi:hypothetical protein YerA41_155 [Yersinia phage YerA41]|nr:hypothetical protein YerA41_155 [Yersinia phage YerA41]